MYMNWILGCIAARLERPVYAEGSAVRTWWTGLKLSRSAQTAGVIPASNVEPLILTARMEAAAQERFAAQRSVHFPVSRNFVAAHITLFHALPGSERSTIDARLEQIALATPPITAQVTGLRSLGRGVAYQLDAPQLGTLRGALAAQWEIWLTNQDRARFRAHVTVQNKVSTATARETLALLEADFQPSTFLLTGVTLWRYLGGPWQRLSEYAFQSLE